MFLLLASTHYIGVETNVFDEFVAFDVDRLTTNQKLQKLTVACYFTPVLTPFALPLRRCVGSTYCCSVIFASAVFMLTILDSLYFSEM